MTKAKATKLDTEIKEALFDPKTAKKRKAKHYDPKSHADEMSEKIMKTPLRELAKWESDFDAEVYEDLTLKAKARLNTAWKYHRKPLTKDELSYDSKKESRKAYLKRLSEYGYDPKSKKWDWNDITDELPKNIFNKIDSDFKGLDKEVMIRYDIINNRIINRVVSAVISEKGHARFNFDKIISELPRKIEYSVFIHNHPDIWQTGEPSSADIVAFRKIRLEVPNSKFYIYSPNAIGETLLYDPVPPSRWYEAMVRGIKKSSDVRNPYAIVKSIWAKLSPSGKAKIKARERKGERFRYDLPLPVDKPTRGTGTVRMVKPFKLAEVQVNLSVKDYLTARASGLFQRMKREDGTTALVSRCKSPKSNTNIFIDKMK